MRYVEIKARNAFILPFEEDFLQQLIERAANNNVKKYVKSNIRKWLINEYEPVKPIKLRDLNNPLFLRGQKAPDWLVQGIEKGDTIYAIRIHVNDKERLIHYIDYLNTLHGDISRIPVKELPRLVKEWERTFNKSFKIEDGIEIIHRYSNGFSWVKVFGKDSLNREGKLMNHCVGGYYNQVKENKCEIYSLRDKNNKPHITIEYQHKQRLVYQIKGNSNTPPKEIYIKYLLHFINKILKPLKCNNRELTKLGYFFNKKMYKLQDVPKGTKIELLELTKNIDISHLIIDNILITENYQDKILPKNLKCNELAIFKSDIKINTGTHINYLLLHTSLHSLPDDIQVDEALISYENNDFPYNINIKGVIEGDFNNIIPNSNTIQENKAYIRVHVETGQKLVIPKCRIERLSCYSGSEVTVLKDAKIKNIDLHNCSLKLLTNIHCIKQYTRQPIYITGNDGIHIDVCEIMDIASDCKLPELEIDNLEFLDYKRFPSSWKIHNLNTECLYNTEKWDIRVSNDCTILGNKFRQILAGNNCTIRADSFISNIKCNDLIISPLWEQLDTITIKNIEANNIYISSYNEYQYSSVIFKGVKCNNIYSSYELESNRDIIFDIKDEDEK